MIAIGKREGPPARAGDDRVAAARGDHRRSNGTARFRCGTKRQQPAVGSTRSAQQNIDAGAARRTAHMHDQAVIRTRAGRDPGLQTHQGSPDREWTGQGR